jgi:hypothetical protein
LLTQDSICEILGAAALNKIRTVLCSISIYLCGNYKGCGVTDCKDAKLEEGPTFRNNIACVFMVAEQVNAGDSGIRPIQAKFVPLACSYAQSV